MEGTVKTWQNLGYRVKIQNVRGEYERGFIFQSDDIGVALKPNKSSDKLILIPWTAICTIERE